MSAIFTYGHVDRPGVNRVIWSLRARKVQLHHTSDPIGMLAILRNHFPPLKARPSDIKSVLCYPAELKTSNQPDEKTNPVHDGANVNLAAAGSKLTRMASPLCSVSGTRIILSIPHAASRS